MFRFLRILLLLAGVFRADARVFSGTVGGLSAQQVLEHHLEIFQTAVKNENKAQVKSMIPLDQQTDELVDRLIAAHKSIIMEVQDAAYPKPGFVTGMVFYSHADGGNKMLVNMVIEKDTVSPSGYRFVSVIQHPDYSHKRNFPTCLVGFIWCYLYLIDYLPGSVEEVFGG
ncbi:hypothetical protein GCK72_006796 [Caenorhabditis remanei]|uniref:Uncharacterized protein n=1 Tax=Caenorhabditis remanei TaxID=31234 RepID=A0A6A5HG73_CAERE|nr:hypothetical protein GCK72_006796 [Caenorhabditis remanei]KAF1766838.1 hypothetical protein GCK72_006796 [Caenorhabditis remanei]